MSLFNRKDKKYKWPPLNCHFHVIIEVMQDSIDINAPLIELSFQYQAVPHIIGISSDYTRQKGFFDLEFYYDKNKFTSFQDLLSYGETYLAGLFIHDDIVSIIEEKYVGNPRSYREFEEAEVHL